MATGSETEPRASAEFAESSVLEAAVPSDPSVDVENELRLWNGGTDDDRESILPFLVQRQILLFDERVDIFVAFRSPLIDDVILKAYLSRLAITVEAYALSTAPNPETEAKPPSPKELIFTETIKDSNEPFVASHAEGTNTYMYVVWKVEVFISRPKGKFLKPAIYFQPSAYLKPGEKVKRNILDDEYLPSKVPAALNLLQAFENDPALAGTHPRLSALRISKVAPTAPVAKELTRPIRTGQRRLFRALPALIWRVRYSKVQTSLSDVSLMAFLDLEVAHITGLSISLDEVSLSLMGGEVKAIAAHEGTSAILKPGDQIAYLYKITPDVALDGTPMSGSDGHFLSLKIKARAIVSEECRPCITIEWRTTVDFMAEQNPNLVKAARRLSNPTVQPVLKASNPDALPSHDEQSQQGNSVPSDVNSITVTISGPPLVPVGDIFYWHVFIVNRSEKSRKLAILAMPKRKRDIERHNPPPSSSSIRGARGDKHSLLASAIVDENVVYAKQKQARLEMVDLLCLTTDVKIGHLAPGACYTADLKFLPLTSGVLHVDAVRVVDLATNAVADVRDLPSIVAVENEA